MTAKTRWGNGRMPSTVPPRGWPVRARSRTQAIGRGALMLGLLMSPACAARSSSVIDWRESSSARLRELGVAAPQPSSAGFAATVESGDPLLSAALLELAVAPRPSLHRRVAERYRELNILDAAYEHFARARTLDPRDAEAYEGLARVWRDAGFPDRGLGDAYRSVHYAPSSSTAYNTLGTVLGAVGRWADSRRAYERALALDARAAYVLNNLCYLSFLEGEIAAALATCHAALEVDPGLTAARNNLALAYAAAQREDLALREFHVAGDTAAASYNIGIVRLAEGRYGVASAAFDAASRERPSWGAARARAGKSHALAAKVSDSSR